MKMRIVWRFAAVACAGLALTGCETGRHFVRDSKVEERPVKYVPVEDSDGEGGGKSTAGPRGFFKQTRLPGALSPEGAEIERSLGVYKE